MTQYTEQDFINQLTGKEQGAAPARLGSRFNAEGQFLPEPGNTIVAHVPEGSQTQAGLITLAQKMKALPGAGHFAFTPISSYHMTVFQGVIEFRREEGFWLPFLPMDATIDSVTAHMVEKLKTFPKSRSFKIKPIALTPLGLTVAGKTREDEQALRDFRDQLADCFGYRHPDHDDYTFHITMAYLIKFMPPEQAKIHAQAIKALGDEFLAKVPNIELGTSDFCTFEDMNHFEPVVFDL